MNVFELIYLSRSSNGNQMLCIGPILVNVIAIQMQLIDAAASCFKEVG